MKLLLYLGDGKKAEDPGSVQIYIQEVCNDEQFQRAPKDRPNSITPVTLHVDGTSKHKKSFTTFLASTDERTVGMSLHDIHTVIK